MVSDTITSLCYLKVIKVQYRLEHSDIQTTMNIYTHVTQLQKDNIGNDFAKYMEM